MANDVKVMLQAEIKKLRADIDAQKRVIKHNLGREKAVEEAERHLKELRTRLVPRHSDYDSLDVSG